jgi:hypothetical protein
MTVTKPLFVLACVVVLCGCGGGQAPASPAPPGPPSSADSSPALARVRPKAPARTFVGDYQNGDFTQWPGKNLPPGAAEIGTRLTAKKPPKPYRRAARFTIGLGGPRDRRTEVLLHPNSDDGVPGIKTTWRWYVYFPKGFRGPPNPDGDLILSDWHHTVSGCAPAAIFDMKRDLRLRLRLRAGRTKHLTFGKPIRVQLDPGFEGLTFQGGHPLTACETENDRTFTLIPRLHTRHWYEIVVQVFWTPVKSQGYFNVWVDGCRRTPNAGSPRYRTATMLDPSKWGQVFFKQGIYDPHGWPVGAKPDSVYYTGTRQYRSLEQVFKRPPVCRPGALR